MKRFSLLLIMMYLLSAPVWVSADEPTIESFEGFRKTITDAGYDLKIYPEGMASTASIFVVGGMIVAVAEARGASQPGRIVFPLTALPGYGYQFEAYHALGDAGDKLIKAGKQWLEMSSVTQNPDAFYLQTAGKHLKKARLVGYAGLGLNALGTSLLILPSIVETKEKDQNRLISVSLAAIGSGVLASLITDRYIGSAGSSLSKLKGNEVELLATAVANAGSKLKIYRSLKYIGVGSLVGGIALIASAIDEEPGLQLYTGFGLALGGLSCGTIAYLMPHSAASSLSGGRF